MLASPLLPISRFQFEFKFTGVNSLPAYAGSAWRGAFGHALKQTVCVVKHTACADCLLKTSCAYPYIFETPPPPGTAKMRLYEAAPHPFVINPSIPCSNADDRQTALGLNLFGHGHRYLPYFIHAFAKAGNAGLGKHRQAFELAAVRQITPHDEPRLIYHDGKLLDPKPPEFIDIPPCPKTLAAHLITPLRIKQDGRNVSAERFNFAALFGNLQRRISLLTYFHTDTPLDTDFKILSALSKTITIDNPQLHWQDWTRYSSRQQTEMQMGGLLGDFPLSGDLAPFWPYLWLGQWTHAGKGTSMGLGRYRIEAASLPAFPD